MKKIIYFTAGPGPTVAELAAIAKLNTLAANAYSVEVMSAECRAKISATTISAAAADNSFNDSANGFLTAGFQVGQHVASRGFTGDVANNINDLLITSLTAGKMTFAGTDGDAIKDNAAGQAVVIETVEKTASFGYGIVAADFCCGTVPASYRNAGTPRYTLLDPDAPPRPDNLPATQAVVSNSQDIAITGGTGTTKVTLTIAGGVITGCVRT